MAHDPDWGGGYPVGQRYFDTVLPEIAPAMMDLSVTVAGRRPPREGPVFRYAELGCGSAYTLVCLAALHPQAEFLGVDFLPEHVARARHLIDAAGLRNVTVEEASFADLAAAPPADRFDYIAIHGVWTWVSEENRAHLLTVMDRTLKPGGVAYVAYNCAAGWAAAAPLRRLFREAPPGPPDAPFGPARAAVEAWLAHDAPESAQTIWKRLSPLPDSYLAHDLGGGHDRPVWHGELAARLAGAKLDYVAPADLAEPFDALRFGEDALAFVKRGADGGWGELARDLATGRTFRADLFARGAPSMAGAESRRRLGDLRIMPWPPLLKGEQEQSDDIFPNLAEAINARLAEGEQTLAAFAAGLDLPAVHALQVGLITVARGAARIVFPPDPGAVESIAGLLEGLRARRADGLGVPGVPAPRLGTLAPLTTSESEALLGLAPAEGRTAEGLARLGIS
jgi:SAM-dependent methyltransferase